MARDDNVMREATTHMILFNQNLKRTLSARGGPLRSCTPPLSVSSDTYSTGTEMMRYLFDSHRLLQLKVTSRPGSEMLYPLPSGSLLRRSQLFRSKAQPTEGPAQEFIERPTAHHEPLEESTVVLTPHEVMADSSMTRARLVSKAKL
ncbi:hypothetical protein Clacol_007742 [Clathrus columnatus]|uniref:Uncharacterized protein n=1 Tax=Clathrus columnatus TaxID=1419009 RepID=A0AAV5AIZ7_9AGAM|nr:hypothetical protein Clacol_007742 [Clathrus columnatus]